MASPTARSGPLRPLRILTAALSMCVLAACGSGDVEAGSGAPDSQPPAFLATWVPAGLDHHNASIAPQYIRWGDAGKTTSIKAESYVFAGDPAHRGSHLSVSAVSARVYPADFWTRFKDSSSYEHKRLGEIDAAIRAGSGRNSTVVMGYDRGYILQVTAAGISQDDVEHFVSGLQWRRASSL